jgi:hypothetical protein
MISDRRNPYLIIGVDFATGKSEARREFARKAKQRRRETNPVYSVEDLTWALSEIEDAIERPDETVEIFRVPADRDVFRPRSAGLLNPPPAVLPRSTVAHDEHALAATAHRAAADVFAAVLVELAATIRMPVALPVAVPMGFPPPTLDQP